MSVRHCYWPLSLQNKSIKSSKVAFRNRVSLILDGAKTVLLTPLSFGPALPTSGAKEGIQSQHKGTSAPWPRRPGGGSQSDLSMLSWPCKRQPEEVSGCERGTSQNGGVKETSGLSKQLVQRTQWTENRFTRTCQLIWLQLLLMKVSKFLRLFCNYNS